MRINVPRSTKLAVASFIGATCAFLVQSAPVAKAAGDQIAIGLVTKTEVNPYFVKLRQAAPAESEQQDPNLIPPFAKFHSPNAAHTAPIQHLTHAHAKPI